MGGQTAFGACISRHRGRGPGAGGQPSSRPGQGLVTSVPTAKPTAIIILREEDDDDDKHQAEGAHEHEREAIGIQHRHATDGTWAWVWGSTGGGVRRYEM